MNNLRGDFLAGAAVALLGGTIWMLFYADFPPSSKDVLLVVIGALISINKDVYGFEFGASKGGERSAQAMREMSKDAAAKIDTPSSPIKADDVKVEAAGDVTVENKP
jgi:hypothetical protein